MEAVDGLNQTYAHLLPAGETFEGLALRGVDSVATVLGDMQASPAETEVILGELFPHAPKPVLDGAYQGTALRVTGAAPPCPLVWGEGAVPHEVPTGLVRTALGAFVDPSFDFSGSEVPPEEY